jgi:endonuclease/exonuclease/phosphatase family metal-dependent hydrolase
MKNIWISVWLAACLMPLSAQNHEPGKELNFEPKGKNVLRIMSYNVHNFVGMDGKMDFRRIAEVINRMAPDVVAIQEADSVTQRSAGVYTLNEAAALTGMIPTYAPAIDFQGGKYGIGILSKKAPVSVTRHPLPGREEGRMLLVAEFEKYIVACTHFSLTEEDRLASVDIIEEAARGATKPFFLAGDLNASPDSPPINRLSRTFTSLTDVKQNTFPSGNPKECIDYVYVYRKGKECKALRSVVIDEAMASDHRPVCVDVRLPKSR